MTDYEPIDWQAKLRQEDERTRAYWLEMFGFRWDGRLEDGARILARKLVDGELKILKAGLPRFHGIEKRVAEAHLRMSAKWENGKMVDGTGAPVAPGGGA